MARLLKYTVAGRMRPCQNAMIGWRPLATTRWVLPGAFGAPPERGSEGGDDRIAESGEIRLALHPFRPRLSPISRGHHNWRVGELAIGEREHPANRQFATSRIRQLRVALRVCR